MTVRIDWEEQGVLLEFSGIVTMSDYREGLTDMFADQRYKNSRYAICDYLDLTGSEFSHEQVEVIAAFANAIEKVENLIVAVVATNPGTLTKAKLYATHAIHPFSIFTHIADARKWIQARMAAV